MSLVLKCAMRSLRISSVYVHRQNANSKSFNVCSDEFMVQYPHEFKVVHNFIPGIGTPYT